MLKNDLIKALKFVAHAAGKKDVRYFLNGILFEFGEEKLTLVATDGHRLAHAVVPCGERGPVGLSVIVGHDDVKRMLATLELMRGEVVKLRPGAEPRGMVIADSSFDCVGIDTTYPDWRRTVPRATVDTQVTALQVGYLEDAAKAFKVLGKSEKYFTVRVELHGAGGVTLLRPHMSHPLDPFVQIMPVRL